VNQESLVGRLFSPSRGVENPAEVLVRLTTYGIGARREKL
jgi:hypothetical protein